MMIFSGFMDPDTVDTGVTFHIVQSWVTAEIIALYRSAGWWEDWYDPHGVPSLISGSFLFATGVDQHSGKAIAMGRILSDQVHTGYIQDLCVLDSYRGMGIGRSLLAFLVSKGKEAGLHSIQLIAEPGTQSFYEKSGFITHKSLIFLTRLPEDPHED